MSTVLLKINGECYKLVMETMVVISLRMPTALRASLERVAARLDETEGEFIRRAIADRLEGEGEKIPDEVLKRKSRKGVGGYPTHRPKEITSHAVRPGGPHNFKPIKPQDGVGSADEKAKKQAPPRPRTPTASSSATDVPDTLNNAANAFLSEAFLEMKGSQKKSV